MAAPSNLFYPDSLTVDQMKMTIPSAYAQIVDAGSDSLFLDRVSKAFEVTASSNVTVVLRGGQELLIPAVAGARYPMQVVQLKATGTTLAGASVIFYQ